MDPLDTTATAVADSDSTVTSQEGEENTDMFCDNPTRDILADGIIGVFKSSADLLQDRVQRVRESQLELRRILDGMVDTLAELKRAQDLPPEFEERVRKLISIKHKVTVVYNVLNTSQVWDEVLFFSNSVR